MGRQHRAAYIPPFRDVACERMAGGLCLREKPHVSDDETVANMGHPIWLFFFFLEDEVGGRGAGGDEGDCALLDDHLVSQSWWRSGSPLWTRTTRRVRSLP